LASISIVEPQIMRKGPTRPKGFNERIIALYGCGMTARGIRHTAHRAYQAGIDDLSHRAGIAA
jgi:hypothetical protein